jgi:NAD(P)-dependent dehydrogenase (short-subunit alcohol dehydrogenase family)
MTQYVLISGASSGIGKAASEALADAGMTVFAGALNDNEAQQIRANGRAGIVPVVLDVTSIVSIEAAIEQIRQTIGSDGKLNGLVSCAGVDFNAPLQTLEVREITQMVNVNYLGSMLLTRAAMSLMGRDSSRIVLVSSAMGLLPTPIVTVYASTKTAIEGFADALRVEVLPLGIKVSVVEPGVIRTPMTKAAPELLEKMLARMDSSQRAMYEPAMRKISEMSANPKAGVTTEFTSRAILDALTARKPARRYQVGADSKMAKIVGLLPNAMQDWIHRRLLGL